MHYNGMCELCCEKKGRKLKKSQIISHPYPWFNVFIEDSIEIMEEINTDQMSEPETAKTHHSANADHPNGKNNNNNN